MSRRVVVLGYHGMGCLGLRALVEHGFEVTGVATHPDDPGEEVWWSSVAETAEELGLPLHFAERVDPALESFVRAAEPDLLFSFYFRYLIPPAILALAPGGRYNLHGSLLPRYRGRAPVNWALVHGERTTGVSLHHMVARADAGDLVDQEEVPIDRLDTAFTLYGKLEGAARRLLDRSLPALADGTAVATPLDLGEGSYFGRRTPADGEFDWAWPAQRIFDLVRAVTHPYPGAFTSVGGDRLLVWWALPVEGASGEGAAPGTIVAVGDDGVTVAAGEGLLRLITVQLSGQPELPAAVLARAVGLAPGGRIDSLGRPATERTRT